MSVEYNLGMVAGSLACLRPLFVKIGWATSSSDNSGQETFTPSYELDRPLNWRDKLRGRSHERVQGDSVLATFATMADERTSKHRGESQECIIRTGDASIASTERNIPRSQL